MVCLVLQIVLIGDRPSKFHSSGRSSLSFGMEHYGTSLYWCTIPDFIVIYEYAYTYIYLYAHKTLVIIMLGLSSSDYQAAAAV